MENVKRVLVLAPHTDDGEFGCGGAVAKFLEMGKDVYYVAFSDCKKSLGPDFPPDTLTVELMKATDVLGIPAKNVVVKGFEVRCFERDRQDILEEMVDLNRHIKPDLVFLPSPKDLHQDHMTVAMEGIRAFKLSANILGYEMPWNNISFDTTCFVNLTESHLQKKISALRCYESQRGRFYAAEEIVRSLAVVRGTQVNTKYAEGFEVLRWTIK